MFRYLILGRGEALQGSEGLFRVRGTEVSRIEGFSDCVLAFALTLLVVSLEVPRNFDALVQELPGFAGFVLCFLLFMVLWQRHYHYFRRYGLQDRTTLVLNSLLLLVILFFVYPLKFLGMVISELVRSACSGALSTDASHLRELIRPGQLGGVIALYFGGFLLVQLLFAALHRHAWMQRAALGLDAYEELATRTTYKVELVIAGMCALVLPLAASGPALSEYSSLPLLLALPVVRWMRRPVRRLERERRLQREQLAPDA
jgi:hypothetical protein